jgi:hypothetical protein
MSARAHAALARAPSAAPERSGFLQRRCACGQHVHGGGSCTGCRAAARDTNLGEVQCTNGELVRSVAKEHPVGNCVELHEKTHQADPNLIAACRGFAACRARDDGGVDRDQLEPGLDEQTIGGLCQSKYQEWLDRNKPEIEYPAWSAEQQCITEVIDARCGAGAKRDARIGLGVGAGVLGAGGAVGGGFAGAAVGQSTSKSSGAGGVGAAVGALAGSAVGAGLGALAGYFIGKAAAGPQASESDCEIMQNQLAEVKLAVAEYAKTKGSGASEVPFEADGRIKKTALHGLLKPPPKQSAAPENAPAGAGAPA